MEALKNQVSGLENMVNTLVLEMNLLRQNVECKQKDKDDQNEIFV